MGRRQRIGSRIVAAAAAVFVAFAISAAHVEGLDAASSPDRRPAGRVEITPVQGVSVIERLQIPFDDAPFGRLGRWGPPPFPDYQNRLHRAFAAEDPGKPFSYTGADVYRMSCQSCHKPDGTGMPPSIKSVVGPVQATSPDLVRSRLKEHGVTPEAAMVRQLRSQAQAALRDRLKKGGEQMPPFDYFRSEELGALLSYLEELAGVPGGESRQVTFSEPPARAGELLVKGTCHVCHSAVGPGPDELVAAGNLEGIPSLASFPREILEEDVLRKVLLGYGRDPLATRGRMPVFDYLSQTEVSAAYRFLVDHPPRP